MLDFLRGTSLRYAISHDPFIYDSLVKQFWRTASLRLAELGPLAIVATIDGAQYTISKASVKSNLQLADEGGTNIPPSDHDQPSSSRLNKPDEKPLTSTFVEDETARGSFHESLPSLCYKTTSLESELKDTKKTLGTAIITLVERVKNLEGALKKRKRKPIISDSDDDAERVEKEIDMDSLLALANASLAEQQSSFVTPSKDNDSGESQEQDISSSTLAAAHILSQTKLHAERVAKSPAQVSSRSVKTYTRANIPDDIFVTPGNMPISTGSGTIPAGVSVPSGSSTFPAGSEPVPPVSTSVDKGKAQLVDELTPTQERTFKQLECNAPLREGGRNIIIMVSYQSTIKAYKLLWQDELLACQLDQDFDIPASK
ncbi:hypothetical protein Tco_1000095 [Tanacetum coccineum]